MRFILSILRDPARGRKAGHFHVIRTIKHHFLACWRDIDPIGSKNRSLLSLMRRHRQKLNPWQQEELTGYFQAHRALEAIHRFKQRLCYNGREAT